MSSNTPIKKAVVRPLDNGDRIGVSFGVTLNMGDYQSLKVEAWAEGTKREGETATAAYKRLYDQREANRATSKK
jgi:hypothetical protein